MRCPALVMALAAIGAAQQQRTVNGTILEASRTAFVLSLGQDGPLGKRGTATPFLLNSSTVVILQMRPAGPNEMEPNQHATVRYVDGKGGHIAKYVRLLGAIQRGRGRGR